MKIKTTLNVATEATDKDGNKLPPSKDIILLQSIDDEIDYKNMTKKDIEVLNSFEAEIQKHCGYIAINENDEAFFIPPYNGVAETIRHELPGNFFTIIDIEKVATSAFMTAERINDEL